MIVLDTGEELDARAVSDDEDRPADDEELWGAEVETTAEVDVVIAEDSEVEGRGMGVMVKDEVKPGAVDVEDTSDVMVGVDDNGESVCVDIRDEAEDKLSELVVKEDHRGVLELDQVLAPAVPEFAIDDEELGAKLYERAPDNFGRTYLKLDDTGLDNG